MRLVLALNTALVRASKYLRNRRHARRKNRGKIRKPKIS